MPSYSGSLVNANHLKATENHVAAMLFYSQQKHLPQQRLHIFPPKIYYHMQFQGPKWH
jgi:hypothetical protein